MKGVNYMNHERKRKWYAIAGMTLLLVMSVFSTTVISAEKTTMTNSIQSLKEINDDCPWTCSRLVSIDAITVYQFTDPMFELYSFVGNHGRLNVAVRITHMLIKPDGDKEQVSWWEGTLRQNQGVETWIMCAYLDEQYGKYTYRVTVQDSAGSVLDQKSMTWVREPFAL
jgi:hypothetical protein